MLNPALLTDQAKLLRGTPMSGGSGRWKPGHAVVGSYSLRVRQASAREVIAASQRQAVISHVLYGQQGNPMQRGDRWLLDDGRVMEVVAVAKRVGVVGGDHVQADAMEVALQPQRGEDVGGTNGA